MGVGPGCSSLGVGAFSENGPFRPKGNVLVKNEFSWNKGNHKKVSFFFLPAKINSFFSVDFILITLVFI